MCAERGIVHMVLVSTDVFHTLPRRRRCCRCPRFLPSVLHPECVFSRPLLLSKALLCSFSWQRQRRSTSLPTAAQTPTTQTMTPVVVKELIPTSDHSPSILPTIDLPLFSPLLFPLISLLSMARHPTTFSRQPNLLFLLIALYLP